ETFHENELEKLTTPPVGAILAHPSWLVCKVPDDRNEIPFTVAALLNCMKQFELKVAPNAQAPNTSSPGTDEHPEVQNTALDVPYRLLLSPDRTGRWDHSAGAVTHNEHTELWHTRL